MHPENCKIKTWKQFARHIRPKGCGLLKRLDQFPDSILITGCQRSGTTILSRVITQSEGMVNYWFGKDDELDAALILSGAVDFLPAGRYCFQTTYVNECYEEYFDRDVNFKLVWVLRNPYSVVYSLLYHWRRWTLNELFHGCGARLLDGPMARRYRRFGPLGVPRLTKASLSYCGKVTQLFELMERLDKGAIYVVEYDRLAMDRDGQLKKIYAFLELDYKRQYSELIHQKSINKQNRLSEKERDLVRELCLPIYEDATRFIA